VRAGAEIWHTAETLPRDQLAALQLERLQRTLQRVLTRQPPIAARLEASSVTSLYDIASLDDIVRLPFSTKADRHQHYPFGLVTVPREEILRVHAPSGTHGKPTMVADTRGDLETWTELMARCMWMSGVRPGMVIHNANGYGLFTGGLGSRQGGERIGATVVPVSGGLTARQALLLADLGAHVLVATPSYALAIAQELADEGVDKNSLRLQLGLFGAEPWSRPMRVEIERGLRLKAINFYGLSELCGPGVLLRYRTRDLGTVVEEPCECGRTTVRLDGLRGRLDDMLIVRGVNLYPSQVEHALLAVDGTAPHYRLLVERHGALDEVTLECEASDSGDHAELKRRIANALHQNTGLRIVVTVLEPGSLPRSEGKAVRVVDRRTLT
jgi:phenylacetate-CoA ligase